MADIIKVLPDHVANQIAAGEVVQRPASVVKELLENAIDAKATSIKLIVKDGGKSLIQVVDNGVGMTDTDARLSFERHATSKINCADDLFNLNTKGFRGEALASIAAIAHVDLQTKTSDAEIGTRIKIEGSKVVSQEVIVIPKGTSIAIKNLFFNIPARRNFLKSNQVELRHITDEFQRVALAHPTIEFHYYNNGSELFNLPKASLKQRIIHVFGSKTNEKLIPVEEQTEVVKITGFVSKPEYAKKSRGEQFFFANNRYIKSPYLHHAIMAAYEALLKPDTIPGYFLFLEVDPSTIDINIHPTKTEVKFEDEHTLYAILRSAVKHALGQFNVAPVLDFEFDQNLQTPYNYKNKLAAVPKVTVDPDFNPFEAKSTPTDGKHTHSFKKENVKGWETLYEGLAPNAENFSSLSFESEAINEQLFSDDSELLESKGVTFQIKRKYIVSTVKSGMLILDQNKAHQRVLYENFLKQITVQQGVSQQLLFPIEHTLSPSEITILNEIRTSLENIGLVFEELNKETVKITGIPALMSESSIGTVLDDLISNYKEGLSQNEISQADLLAKILCKSLAIKAGDILEPESQMALLNDLFACKEQLVSPFQKKIYIIVSESDIDKKFI